MTRTHFSSHIEFNNFKANIMQEPLHNGIALEFSRGGGGVLSYICFISIGSSKDYGFCAVLV